MTIAVYPPDGIDNAEIKGIELFDVTSVEDEG